MLALDYKQVKRDDSTGDVNDAQMQKLFTRLGVQAGSKEASTMAQYDLIFKETLRCCRADYEAEFHD